MPQIYYMDPVNGDDSKDGKTFANRRRISLPSYAAGDEIRFIESDAPVNTGFNAAWVNGSAFITLSQAKSVNLLNGTFVPAPGVTHAADAVRFKATSSHRLTVPDSFTTGKIFHVGLTGSQSGSGKTRISFWFLNDIPVLAGQLRLNICTDAGGSVIFSSFNLPAIPGVNCWVPIVIDGSFPANIASWSMTAQVPITGVAHYNVDNVTAVESQASGGISLHELIGKPSSPGVPGSDGSETWYAPDSIIDTQVRLSVGPNDDQTTSMPYRGTSESIRCWTLNPFRMNALADADGTPFLSLATSGTNPGFTKVGGGWDRNTMQNQTGVTWFDGRDGRGYCLYLNGRHHLDISGFSFSRFRSGIRFNNACKNVVTCHSANNCQGSGISAGGQSSNNKITLTNGTMNHEAGYSDFPDGANNRLFLSKAQSNNQYGVELCHNTRMIGGSAYGNRLSGILACGACYAQDATTDQNGVSGIFVAGTASGGYQINLHNSKVNESTVVSGLGDFTDARVASHHHGQVKNNHWVWTDGGVIVNEQGPDRHTQAGFAWKISPSAPRSSDYPLDFPLCSIAVLPGRACTVTGWFKRTSADIHGFLFVAGKQIDGVPTDVLSADVSPVAQYQQLSITFTPTEQGVIDVYARVYGGTGDSVWVDDMTAVQA